MAMHEKLDILHKDQQQALQVMRSLKTETSDNPRKELMNQGITWSKASFAEAVRAGDVRAVNLFLAGGMRIDGTQARIVLKSGSAALQTLFLQHAALFDDRECRDFKQYIYKEDVLAAYHLQQQMVSAFCSNAGALHDASDALARARASLQEKRDERNVLVKWRDHPEQCVADFISGRGPRLSIEGQMEFSRIRDEGGSAALRPWGTRVCSDVGDGIALLRVEEYEAEERAAQIWLSWIHYKG